MNERERFHVRLARGPLLADGGMGTLLFSRGIPQRACLDELVATRPDLIGAIHREYLEAGADILETATFGANRSRLAGYGLADQTARLNRRGAQLAREARDVGGRDVLVGGSIGPLANPTRELASHDEAAIRAAFREQIDGLLEGGVDLFVLETFSDLLHLRLAIDEARRAADLPILAEMTFGEELVAADGTTPEVARSSARRCGRRRHRGELRRRAVRLPRGARSDGRSSLRDDPIDHAQCRAAPADRGPVRVRRRARLLRRDRAADARCGRRDRRRVLRDDPRARRRDAGGARRHRGERARPGPGP